MYAMQLIISVSFAYNLVSVTSSSYLFQDRKENSKSIISAAHGLAWNIDVTNPMFIVIV